MLMGAFDALPHSILFAKAKSIIPDHFWRILVFWYGKLSGYIKWNGSISKPFTICKGTRQGGLTSPFLFNIFYEDMVSNLSSASGGITIDSMNYNVFCYADDILLTSTTITGLQKLIDIAKCYGLKFNAGKTQCVTFGKPCFDNAKWYLNKKELNQVDNITYLGAILSDNNKTHVRSRISSCQKAFYALQGAGLCKNGVSPDTLAHIWNAAVRPVLLYGAHCMNLTQTLIDEMETIQCKYIKCANNGLPKYSKNTPIRRAIGVRRISDTIALAQLDLLKSIFKNTSRAHKFYASRLSEQIAERRPIRRPNSLVSRAMKVCERRAISLVRYIYDDKYSSSQKHLTMKHPADGLADSVKQLLMSSQNNELLHMMLSPF